MPLKVLFTRWTRLAALLLMGGALAWTIKLAVIISTNGQIINTGAAALLMKIGIVLLLVGSTAIGHRLTVNRTLWLRILAILISPLLLLCCSLPLAMMMEPLLDNSNIWYAQQEAPIAVVVVISFL